MFWKILSATVYNCRCPGCKNSYKLREIFELHWRLGWACLLDSFQVRVRWTWRYLATLKLEVFLHLLALFYGVSFTYLFTLDKGRARGDCSCWSWCCKVKTEGCRASPPTQSTTATPVWLYSGCKWSPSPPSWSLLAAVRYKFYSFKFLWDVSGSLVAVVFGFLQLSESKGICQQFMPYTKIHFLSLHQWIMLNLL